MRGYDAVYGARPIKRFIQREIENKLALEMLSRNLPEQITVDIKNNGIVFV